MSGRMQIAWQVRLSAWQISCVPTTEPEGALADLHGSSSAVQCPAEGCEGDRAYFYQLQIRSADEPMTSFCKVLLPAALCCDIVAGLTLITVHYVRITMERRLRTTDYTSQPKIIQLQAIRTDSVKAGSAYATVRGTLSPAGVSKAKSEQPSSQSAYSQTDSVYLIWRIEDG